MKEETMPRPVRAVVVAVLMAGAYLLGTTQPVQPLRAQTGDEQCFQETGKCIRGAFLRYWQANGGLRQQGYPISDEVREQNAPPPAGDGQVRTVQYFQRARFELHEEFAGTENEVLLGLLGSEQHQAKYGGVPPAGVGTRENPIPLGTPPVALGDGWQVRVASIMPDATEVVLRHNQSNKPPGAGKQFFMARVTATYTGEESSKFLASLRLSAVGASSVEYSIRESCGAIPDEFPWAEVFSGGTVTGNICWQVATSDVPSLVMYDNGQAADERIFFALTP
jgi:hypothetical protein